uniref:LysM domain-containing protein n=1 Tax=Hemiselmis andersenii TaxID=464988 RepID=A0A7S0THB5_HEMAN
MAATPADGAVFRADCRFDSFVRCPAISFHAIWWTGNATTLTFDTGGVIINDETVQCDVPSTGVFVNYTGTAPCNKTDVVLTGLGADWRGGRVTVKPLTYYINNTDSYVCFRLGNPAGGTFPQRCVYFDVVVLPRAVQVQGPGVSGSTIRVSIGEQLRLRVFTTHLMSDQHMDIGLREEGCDRVDPSVLCPSPELPRQSWEGPTSCVFANDTNTMTCERYLLYTPTKEENGQEYRLSFQGGFALPAPEGEFRPHPAGTSCDTAEGLCFEGPYLDRALTNFKVVVNTPEPEFVTYDPDQVLFERPGVYTDPPVYTLAGTPFDGSVQPRGFINCPLRGFGIFVRKTGTAPENLNISLVPAAPGTPDALSQGLTATREYLAAEDEGGDNVAQVGEISEFTTYIKYVGVAWTPTKEALGQTFQVCFRASETVPGGSLEISSRQACVFIPIERCMYCTVRDDTLQSVAARFRTTWLQIWTANYPGWYGASFAESGVEPWVDTRDPDHLPHSLLIRLGPVYKATHDGPLASLIDRFQTTREAIEAANPQVTSDMDTLRAGEQLCILPEICTDDEGGA